MARIRFRENGTALRSLVGLSFLPASFPALFFLVTVILFTSSSATVAENRKPTEYEVKAAYLYNFGQFVSWQNERDTVSFTMCVLGTDPFGNTLDKTVEGGLVNGKTAAVRRISDVTAAKGCQILFIAASEANRASKILKTTDSSGTLTVSDLPHFCESGGMIQFVQQGERIRFEVNLSAARASGLTLSSELLKLAVKIIQSDMGTGV